MNKLLGTSWKTSLLGMLSGSVLIIQSFVDKGEVDISKIILAVLVYLLGRFASDNTKNEVK
jgi:hypothetical protein